MLQGASYSYFWSAEYHSAIQHSAAKPQPKVLASRGALGLAALCCMDPAPPAHPTQIEVGNAAFVC